MTKSVYISKHVIFNDTVFLFADYNGLSLPIQDISQIQEYPTCDEWLQYPSATKIPNTPPVLKSSLIVLTAVIPFDTLDYFSNVAQNIY